MRGPQLRFDEYRSSEREMRPSLPCPNSYCTLFHLVSCVSKVVVLFSSTEKSFLPSAFFVVMRITPCEARLPYRADAAGPLSTDRLSISSGLMLDIPSPRSNPPHWSELSKLVLSIGTPSTTYSGWLLPVSSVLPRSITRVEPAGPVAVLDTVSPATFPANELTTFTSLAFCNSSPFTSPSE